MDMSHAKTNLKIAVIGGGTGSFGLLSGLKSYTQSITALVNMVDDGGSTGILRDEMGTLPSGDIRQCLVALSDSPKIRDLFNYRFSEGTFEGHAFGNLLLSVLEKTTGSFNDAVQTAAEILGSQGSVVPATLDNVRLRMEWPEVSVTLKGERIIDSKYFEHDPRRATLSLVPRAHPNPAMITAIEQADLVLIAPGDLYTSLGPLLIIDGVGDALRKTHALVMYVANLVTKKGQTEGFTVSDHVKEIERFAGGAFLDYVLYNKQIPSAAVMRRYEAEGARLVEVDAGILFDEAHYQVIGGDFLGKMAVAHSNDILPVTRSLIRHDTGSVADAIIRVYESRR